MYHNIIKATYDKPTVNIIFNGERMKAFPLRTGTRQGYILLPLLLPLIVLIVLFHTIEVLHRAIKVEKKKF